MIKCRVGRGYEEGSSKSRDAVRVFLRVVRGFLLMRMFSADFYGADFRLCGFLVRGLFVFYCADFFVRIFCVRISVRILTRIFGGVFLGQGDRRENDKNSSKNPSPKSSQNPKIPGHLPVSPHLDSEKSLAHLDALA